ncbi:uncharacterized protein BDW47DRAFT_131532 [Aspergillus candidus]|uniref:Ilp is an apoptosis inhibitor n=1 Tax=Aspergillus candidus TaxID=41067 RepID=A0A2I2FCF7_ASPCN|nr:hypothetical protein BDW47DRAFT_131532 [Aspergillus candidus]PLB38292.1 hypothetical protein BDW47DRAFT_131532 [Aspergillus candidus]
MTFNFQSPGRDCWAAPSPDAHDPSSTFYPTKATDPALESELSSGRRDNAPLSPVTVGTAEHPAHWPASPAADEMAASPSSAIPDVSQVNLPDWHARYTASTQYFLEYGQHAPGAHALAAYLNFRLPCQRPPASQSFVGLRPYVRRLIATAHDTPDVLQMLFGPDWHGGVGRLWQQERINYLFTAKSGGWASTKAAYDGEGDEQVPFLRPIRDVTEEELHTAESRWSEWLAMEDWMVGTRSPW